MKKRLCKAIADPANVFYCPCRQKTDFISLHKTLGEQLFPSFKASKEFFGTRNARCLKVGQLGEEARTRSQS
jgi:hypothetical protein